LSGQDIQSHEDDPLKVVKIIRNWLSNKTEDTIPSPSNLIQEYNEFKDALPELCAENKWIPTELTFNEYSALVTNWLAL
jgi:hypothetical protein